MRISSPPSKKAPGELLGGHDPQLGNPISYVVDEYWGYISSRVFVLRKTIHGDRDDPCGGHDPEFGNPPVFVFYNTLFSLPFFFTLVAGVQVLAKGVVVVFAALGVGTRRQGAARRGVGGQAPDAVDAGVAVARAARAAVHLHDARTVRPSPRPRPSFSRLISLSISTSLTRSISESI